VYNANLQDLCKQIKYQFNDISILEKSLIHPSVKKKKGNYERMEFFGDSILGFIISEFLYNKYPDINEGELSKMYSFFVSRKICALVGKNLKIADFILFSSGAENNNERNEDANISNAVEVLIAAIYIDGGINEAKKFITTNWKEFTDQENLYDTQDHKTKLQQISQEKYKILPIYNLLETEGPDHSPIFKIGVKILNFSAIGTGKNKKDAEQSAAKLLIGYLMDQKI
jgi:ribonuclease-3